LAVSVAACGKKGPPLPPIVRLPVPPADFAAERRGDEVSLQFTVPGENTDRSRPANLERVDVYAFTGPTTVNDEQLVKRGATVARVANKPPKDPTHPPEEDEPAEETEFEDAGLPQGAVARADDAITLEAMKPIDLSGEKLPPGAAKPAPERVDGPLLTP